MFFKDEKIEEIVKLKVGKNIEEQLVQEDIRNIVRISLCNENFNGDKVGVDLSEIDKMSMLEELSLKGFYITNEIKEKLKKMKLVSLQMMSCEFEEGGLLEINSLKRIYLTYCNKMDLANIKFPEEVYITGNDNLNLGKFQYNQNIKVLHMKDCNIRRFHNILKFNNLKMLNIDGSKIDSKKVLKILELTIEISAKKENFRII